MVHINRPSSTCFIARVRSSGARSYELIGKPTRSRDVAIKRMAKAFADGDYKRGDVILVADYYDPIQVVEMVRK